MTQMRFLNDGKMTDEHLMTKVVGLRFNPASESLKDGQTVEVRPVTVEGFSNVLGVFISKGQVGNILSNKSFEEIEFEACGGKVFTNHDLVNDLRDLTFVVKKVNKFDAVLIASF